MTEPLFPVLRCMRCGRVRKSIYEPWTDHPARFKHEVEGMCRTCMDTINENRKRQWVRDGHRLLKARRTGYGPCSPDEDPFKGLRET